MKHQRNETLEKEILKAMNDEFRDPDRGIGVTSYIYCLTKLYYQNHMLPQENSREATLLFATGLYLEKLILIDRQIEDSGTTVEGIGYHIDSFNPTLFALDGITPELMEIKSTRQSMNKPKSKSQKTPDDFNDSWIRQIKSYCYIKGITKASLAVLFLMGDYRPPFPDIRAWELEFEQDELDANWGYILGRKDFYDQADKANLVPRPYTYNYAYECDNCSYKMMCELYKDAPDKIIG